jgi:hypothetical protein
MSKKTARDWSKLANSPDYEDQFDELYEEEVIHQSKQKRKEQVRFGFEEER